MRLLVAKPKVPEVTESTKQRITITPAANIDRLGKALSEFPRKCKHTLSGLLPSPLTELKILATKLLLLVA